MGLFDSLADIANKLLPTQKRRDINRLQALEKLYAKALMDNRDTDAAMYRKEMANLRKILGYSDE